MADNTEHGKPLTLRTIWEDYRDTTGFHAINKITFGRRHPLGRSIFWLILWLLSAGYVLYIVTLEVINYYQYPTILSVSKRMAEELEFPTITICNLSTRNRSKIVKDTRTDAYYISLYKNGFNFAPVNWSDPFYESEGYFRSRIIQDLYDESKDTFRFIPYHHFDFLPYAFNFTPVPTDLGLCARGSIEQTTNVFGGVYNLHAYIDISLDDDYYSNRYFSSGIKVAVHDKFDEVIMANTGFVVPPASEVFVEVSREEYKYLPYPFAAFENDVCEDKHANYSESKCVMECIRQKVLKQCSCVDFMFKSNDGTYCSKEQFYSCFSPAYWNVLETGLGACECPIKCQYTSYVTSATMGKFPSDFITKHISSLLNKTETYVRKNLISLRIYYKDLRTTVTEQIPKYENPGDLFSNLGGQMGLFLGASILTLTELFEFFLFVLWYLIVHLTSRNVMVSSENPLYLSKKVNAK